MIFNAAEQGRKLSGTECDLCILGAGPAGIVTALEAARARPDWRIVVLEGGGLAPGTPEDNDPYQGTTSETAYPLAASRLRYLGGTSNHWGGWCRPLDEEDFQARPHMPLSGWPIGRGELDAYYRRAATWCEIASDRYDAGMLPPTGDGGILDLGSSKVLENRLFRFSPPTRFGTRYRDDLHASANVEVWLNASAVGLDFKSESIASVALACPGIGVVRLKTKQVVVALGGVESARLLLLHRDRGGAASGLASPFLGRCFADHLGFMPARALLPAKLSYQRQTHASGPLMPILCLNADVQKALALPNVFVMPTPQSGVEQIDKDYPHNQALAFNGSGYWNYRMQFVIEPRANPDSRLTLTNERDRLGLPRVNLDWRVHPEDRRGGDRALKELALEVGALGLGRIRIHAPENGFDRERPSVVFHHMGATRMATTNEAGVVDADCRVHGIENLHVASSSVFPAFGFSNPTLTIVALAVRLAEKLTSTSTVKGA